MRLSSGMSSPISSARNVSSNPTKLASICRALLWPTLPSSSSASLPSESAKCLNDAKCSTGFDEVEGSVLLMIFLATPLVFSVLEFLSRWRCVELSCASFCLCWSNRSHEAGSTPLILR
ncbi:hypothetical protein BDV38DRAFT_266204 [Aspergillus pseudotamarii]|uniref:Uncharacterized protein n=1 Tax=Aspergillus pseudotamarii TaxID=132259 RepID=A0A5N6SAU1_ASPPS|nr:uncharacterized protein BDV38DRAFT_266204 [Aspergillus pseudotamarii]KAE8130800.1 hypothetical protein BDV38DRAFT_266204 [Aspergillus pseudotamarii]